MELSITAKELILTSQEVTQVLKCSASTLKRLKAKPGFPKAFRLGGAQNSPDLWRLEDLKAWIDGHYQDESASSTR